MTGGPDLIERLLATAEAHPDAPALTGPPRRFRRAAATLTHAGLAGRVRGVAALLHEHGFRPGERMLFSVRPSPDAVVLALGTVAAGGTVVFVDPGVGPALFAARTGLAAAGWAAAESVLHAAGRWPLRALARRRGVLLPDYSRLPVRHVRVGPWLPGVPRGALAPVRGYGGQGDHFRARVPEAQDAVVVFTAGTTAEPRAVVHTRGSLGAGLDVLATRCALGPGARVHTDQFLLGLPALVGGAHWSLPPHGFAPGARPDQLAAGLAGATHTFLVPADLAAVLDAVEAGAVALPASLRQVLVGAAPVLPPLLRRARAALPDVELLAVYGMTEILPVAVATAEEKLAHPGPGDLVGAPLPGVVVRVDADGRLVVAGPNLARGHLAELDRGGPALVEHTTDDLARIEDGRIVLAGRVGDMIIRGRTNIYPGLHEPLLARLPGVDQAVLVGVPDALGDEEVVLVLVGEPGAAQRVRAALPGVLDAAALPDRIVQLDALPVAGRTRKVDRAALRELVACGSR